jgi:transcription antitermination factor NusG
VADRAISELRNRIELGEFSAKRRLILAPGSNVRISAGPMSGHEGMIETANQTRARLIVELFGHAISVNIPVVDLALV